MFSPVPESVEKIGKLVVDAAFTVHINLGHGLLEKVYKVCYVKSCVSLNNRP